VKSTDDVCIVPIDVPEMPEREKGYIFLLAYKKYIVTDAPADIPCGSGNK